jgi:hypothetical protein
MTLRDHTRIFFRENYDGTEVCQIYKDRITSEIADDEICRFVQDLRNYMLHMGFPQPQRHMSWDHERGLTTGVRFGKDELAEWDGWSSAAKSLLSKQREFVELPDIISAYIEKIVRLHMWIDTKLREHHQADLGELTAFQNALRGQLREAMPAAYERLMAILPDAEFP